MFSPPNLCFYGLEPAASDIRKAEESIMEFVEEEGPFEGVMGYSHGAEVAASLLVQEEWRERFKFAIFIGGTPPWDTQELAAGQHLEGCKMLPDSYGAMVDLPTAHIIGRSDNLREAGKQLLALCNQRKAKVYDHNGAHGVPRGRAAMEELTAAMDWVVDRATFQ
ncbi:MAG: hypothetical protein LQ338_001585 [Usnochroma carphineum]|nr:MAG: hypothetical protein LQ338_001585 [Usnochroma carphineum]